MLEEESDHMDLIVDYYKEWDSSNAPVMMNIDISDDSSEFSENIENLDEKKLGYLRNKYGKP
ncbi:MAG: hypothetical protein ACFFEN_09015 [Candidatus Thorarchaeota archaeon]